VRKEERGKTDNLTSNAEQEGVKGGKIPLVDPYLPFGKKGIKKKWGSPVLQQTDLFADTTVGKKKGREGRYISAQKQQKK